MTRPSPQQLAVLRAVRDGLDPIAGLTGNARTGRERSVWSCVLREWIELHHTDEGVGYLLTEAGGRVLADATAPEGSEAT